LLECFYVYVFTSRCENCGMLLNGITGYAQVSVVLGPVGSGHATVEYGNSPID